MSIVLIGYRGSGKTSVGKLLASTLGQQFIDTDELISLRFDKPIADIFREAGEAAFRSVETECLEQALARDGAVISLGGGAPIAPHNQKLIRQSAHTVIYLQCDIPELARRIRGDTTSSTMRPSLSGTASAADEIADILKMREPVYRKLAGHIVNTSSQTPSQIVASILEVL